VIAFAVVYLVDVVDLVNALEFAVAVLALVFFAHHVPGFLVFPGRDCVPVIIGVAPSGHVRDIVVEVGLVIEDFHHYVEIFEVFVGPCSERRKHEARQHQQGNEYVERFHGITPLISAGNLSVTCIAAVIPSGKDVSCYS
jgi:hypothetical protein